MYLVETENGNVRCNDANEIKQKYRKNEILNIYSLNKVDYDDLISTADIRDCIYNYLKEKQETKEEVIEFVSNELNIKKSEVSKTITSMKKEKTIYDVIDFYGWIGIN